MGALIITAGSAVSGMSLLFCPFIGLLLDLQGALFLHGPDGDGGTGWRASFGTSPARHFAISLLGVQTRDVIDNGTRGLVHGLLFNLNIAHLIDLQGVLDFLLSIWMDDIHSDLQRDRRSHPHHGANGLLRLLRRSGNGCGCTL